MPNFSSTSRNKLRTLDGKLQRLLCEVIKNYDFCILEGSRTEERQKELIKEGKSQTMNSKHLCKPWSKAVDICPYPIDWDDLNRFHELAGHILERAAIMNIKIKWGGHWESFKDYVHFQLED
jgi:peptidoglycan L-alanyl-D-glutamate endopeptidase CwlK